MTQQQLAQQTIERTFKATLDAVWEMWTTPTGLAAWYGPRGFTATIDALEPVVGGRFDCVMTATGEAQIAQMQKMGRPTSWPNHAVFTKVDPKTGLAFDLKVPMGPDNIATMHHTATFTETDGGVHVVLIIEAAAAPMIGGAAMGWKSALDRLDELLVAAR